MGAGEAGIEAERHREGGARLAEPAGFGEQHAARVMRRRRRRCRAATTAPRSPSAAARAAERAQRARARGKASRVDAG